MKTIAAWLVFQVAIATDASQLSRAIPYSSLEWCEKALPRVRAELEAARPALGRTTVQIEPQCVPWRPPQWVPYLNEVAE